MEITLRIEDCERKKLEEFNLEVRGRDILVLQVPKTFKGEQVMRLGKVFTDAFKCETLSVVTIPEGVTLMVIKKED